MIIKTIEMSTVLMWQLDQNLVEDQDPVVQRMDNTVHYINHSPLDISINFDFSYLLDSE